MPISGLTLEPSLAAFGGIGFLSFHPRPPRLSESDGGQAGRTKEQKNHVNPWPRPGMSRCGDGK